MMETVAATETAKPERASDKVSERRCIVTRESAPRAGLVRFVLGPDAAVVPDLAESLPGRGVWVSAARETLETARSKNIFQHAFRAPAKPPADLVARIERLLTERCIALIGFARRADQLFVGRDQVKAAIGANAVALLLAASDSDGRDATDLAARFGGERFSVLTSAELGVALGREGIVHMGVKPGRLAETLARELRRLQGFRAEEAGPAPQRGQRL
jgi:predicted RNA-binding protein YlxR (DUF448 family)